MEPMKLYFDARDIFRSPRLALSGKKIWLFLKANLFGFTVYWILSYIALVLVGINFSDALNAYGLYPCVYCTENISLISQIVYWVGIVIWILSIFFACTAVSRITYKELKGDDFYSVADARKFVKIHRTLESMRCIFFLYINIAEYPPQADARQYPYLLEQVPPQHLLSSEQLLSDVFVNPPPLY